MSRAQLLAVIAFVLVSTAPPAAQAKASGSSAQARTAHYLDTIRTRPM